LLPFEQERWIPDQVRNDERVHCRAAAGGAGGSNGLNIPPGTADATGLSDPSSATEDTPNTQSSTRMPRKTHLKPAGVTCGDWTISEHWPPSNSDEPIGTRTECSQFAASVLRHRIT
jgi:hypothetical protein